MACMDRANQKDFYKSQINLLKQTFFETITSLIVRIVPTLSGVFEIVPTLHFFNPTRHHCRRYSDMSIMPPTVYSLHITGSGEEQLPASLIPILLGDCSLSADPVRAFHNKVE